MGLQRSMQSFGPLGSLAESTICDQNPYSDQRLSRLFSMRYTTRQEKVVTADFVTLLSCLQPSSWLLFLTVMLFSKLSCINCLERPSISCFIVTQTCDE